MAVVFYLVPAPRPLRMGDTGRSQRRRPVMNFRRIVSIVLPEAHAALPHKSACLLAPRAALPKIRKQMVADLLKRGGTSLG